MSEHHELPEEAQRGGSRIIGRVLPVAVRLWLRSQLESVSQLSIQLAGRDRELIAGRLPKVTVSAENAVYKGIHLSSAELSAENIRINIGQILRGKPLKLMRAFPVLGKVSLTAADLNASLGSALLAEGLEDFWKGLVRSPLLAKDIQMRYGPLSLQPEVTLRDLQVALAQQSIGLCFYPCTQRETAAVPVILAVEMTVVAGHVLRILSARWIDRLADLTDLSQGSVIEALSGFEWDLGTETQISQLTIQPTQLLCRGQLQVKP